MRQATRGTGGFTLIELLVVIAILGLLVVAFVPDLLSAGEAGKSTETEVRIQALHNALESYARETGHYPPDDLQDPARKLDVKADNGVNTGIESLVFFLGQKRAGNVLAENEPWLANTDKDDHGAAIPRLNRSDRVEVVDAWRTPLAYFSAFNGGMERSQRIRMPEEFGGEDLTARALTGEGGAPLGGRKFQLLSAGPDGVFNTDDDISWPRR